MIKIDKLEKKYGKVTALESVSFDVQSGKIVAIAGPNGSGKSTLVKIILGLVRMDNGEIYINDEKLNSHFQYRKQVGYLPQIGRYPENLTVKEVISMIKDIGGGEETFEAELIDEFELQEHLNKEVRTLSGGTKQKLGIILAFMFKKDLLILDEPTSGLDPISAGKLKKLIKERNSEGSTVLLISHIMSEVEELADEIIYFLNGQISFREKVRKLIEKTAGINLENSIAIFLNKGVSY
ncbi:MAG: ABC transporter ATP-binding protein [Candidatus Kapabacteria bacterium]|nr:ABC transporter ATP-binding protein [Candidatus Kapabacteria bacterium]